MPCSSSAVSFPAPGSGRSITYLGIAHPLSVVWCGKVPYRWYALHIPLVGIKHTAGMLSTPKFYDRHPTEREASQGRSDEASPRGLRSCAVRDEGLRQHL